MAGPAEQLISRAENFFAQLNAQAAGEALTDDLRAEIESLGESLWDWANGIAPGESAVRVRRTESGSVLEATSRDMPFLVDSILAECAAQSLSIRALLHPIVSRDDGERRSIIQVHLPELDEHEGAAIALGARRTFEDVAASVDDYDAMRALMRQEIEQISGLSHLPVETQSEAIAFLNWLAEEHFVFLGARTYTFLIDDAGALLREEPDIVEGSSLGVLRDLTSNVLSRDSEPCVITSSAAQYLQEPDPLIIAKSTMISRVHRRVNADYIGVKHYDAEGQVIGETRFVGLFTAEAYDEPVRTIPVVRQRFTEVLEAAGGGESRHSAKALSHILETWPRDELFQVSAEELLPMARGALALVGRPRTRVFLRRDRFDRYFYALAYIPRDAYDTSLREKITDVLERACDGRMLRFQPRFSEGLMIQVYFVLVPGEGAGKLDYQAIEGEIVDLARTWEDAFRAAVIASDLKDDFLYGAQCFRGAFNAAYREAFTPTEALRDVSEMASLHKDNLIRMRAYRMPGDDADKIRAKIYARGKSIPLSACVPVFENMGLFVAFETGYPVEPDRKPVPDAPKTYWVHDLSMRSSDGTPIDIDQIGQVFADAFVAVWTDEAENDGFNQLIFTSGANWREAALLRTLCAYRSQTGMDPAKPVQISALINHPEIARLLLNLFAARFDPGAKLTLDERKQNARAIKADITEALNSVASLDEDRVLQRLTDLINAVQRTNFYHTHKPKTAPSGFIAIKIASEMLEQLPAPKPFREIFTSSPRVDGVHCRFGRVARGGLRWSDRRYDFRTEVLGLVKAQQVKNAVIVPVGSKGGFFPKQLPSGGGRDEFIQAGILAYREFITALLSITDNIVGTDIQHPEETVIWDGEDPYLVVAADKGTATFSDIANEISVAHDFWLGDAFASGGSAGYDHKKMGITARGGWEAVKRHFREIGKDIQSEPFTVIGVGDMSGDVFGNGMLLSRQIKLQAAFNHLHIFIDPNPEDTEAAWEERNRMFELPRSSWEDYNPDLISAGGGVFSRSAKSIELTKEIKALTGVNEKALTPDELINALLKTECELLWFGGIGTYIKAEHETHSQVGDRANDSLRVDGRHLQAKVIGEGANLGVTQAGRIEFAQKGGRINTDAIDNSAGVDSSDHEVNIKILCAEAIRRGDLKAEDRNDLLASMTEDVAIHVLRHNYDQTGALSLAESLGVEDHESHERLMTWLEGEGVLDREVEGLPSSEAMRERASLGMPLTRPEMSVLLAWSKIVLFDEIVASDLPNDPHFQTTLRDYFPEAIRKFEGAQETHRLRSEIIATVLSNRLLDTAGPAFLMRLREFSGAGGAAITRAFEICRSATNAAEILDEITALDNNVPSDLQLEMRHDLTYALSRGTVMALGDERPIAEQLKEIKPAFAELTASLPKTLKPWLARRVLRRAKTLEKHGAPEKLAKRVASLQALAFGPQILMIAREANRPVQDAASAFFTLGETLQLDRLCVTAEESMGQLDYWARRATKRQVAELTNLQRSAAISALSTSRNISGGHAASAWLIEREAEVSAFREELSMIDTARDWSFAKFSLLADAARTVLTSTL